MSKDKVTYCGLYCGLCLNHTKIPKEASSLSLTLKKNEWDKWAPEFMPGFKEFWSFLDMLTNLDKHWGICKTGCGDPGCSIRECAKEKNLESCAFCDNYVCDKFARLAESYEAFFQDALRMKEIGIEAWAQQMEEKEKKGVCYCDFFKK